ncbi:hypothetical protein RQP46_007004 [Phenoliferia psychrophenolica]
MTQANLYRNIVIPSFGRLSKFFRTLSQLSTGLAWRVRHLTLALNRGAEETDSGPSAHKLNQIRHLLRLVINIEELTLRGTARLADVVLDERFAQDSMRQLKALDLDQRSEGNNTRPLSYSRYEPLALYPELRQLQIRSQAAPDDGPVFEPEETPSFNTKVISLTLHGCLSTPSAIDLVSHFPSLTYLEVTDTSDPSDLTLLLKNFEPVDVVLARFENLETLELTNEDTFSDAIFDILAQLPLKTICFECDDLPVTLVQFLVARSETLASLHLHLPFLEAEEGKTMNNWKLPGWTDDFDLDGARDLRDLAIDYGVEICERLADALDLEDRFEEILRPKKSEVETANFPLLTATASAPTDSLSQLPPQVIERIFAYASDLKEPISKVLLAGTNTNLYRVVWLHTYEAAERFCRTIASRPRLGRLVEELFVDFGGSDEDDSDSDAESEASSRAPAPVRAKPTHDDLLRLFAALPLLKEITITNASRVADVILSRTACTRFLRNLEWIDLRDSFDSFRSPWDVRAYEHLQHYPELYLLELHSSEPPSPSRSRLTEEHESESSPNFELGDLILGGNLSESCAGVANLVDHFRSIYSLTIEDFSSSQDLNPILVRAPKSLSNLSIGQLRVPTSVRPVDAALARFTVLEELQIPDDMITATLFDSFLRDPLPLKALSIRHPMLRDEPRLSAPHLLALLRPGPGKLSTLESLEIDIYSGELGTTLDDHDGVPLIDAKGKWRMRPDWVLPDWGPLLSHDDAEDLVVAANQAGVELLGNILEALEVDHAFTHEAMRLDVASSLN